MVLNAATPALQHVDRPIGKVRKREGLETIYDFLGLWFEEVEILMYFESDGIIITLLTEDSFLFCFHCMFIDTNRNRLPQSKTGCSWRWLSLMRFEFVLFSLSQLLIVGNLSDLLKLIGLEILSISSKKIKSGMSIRIRLSKKINGWTIDRAQLCTGKSTGCIWDVGMELYPQVSYRCCSFFIRSKSKCLLSWWKSCKMTKA